jgi:spermidine/putrescine transport system substrate-binding protein
MTGSAELGPGRAGAGEPPGLDPSLWRGLTQPRLTRPRLTRRQVLRSAGAGAAALGAGALLAACGSASGTATGAPAQPGRAGTPAWWAKQKLHFKVNFANWQLYIDTVNGKHPSLAHFTQVTGITVNYTEPISGQTSFYEKIRPSLQAGRPTGYDIIVMTNNSPPLGRLIDNGWLIPLDASMMINFARYAGPLVRNPYWDRGNKYTMAWQSGWTGIGYDSSVIKNPGSGVGILFDKRYTGKIGMLSDLQELGSLGLLAIGVDPATSSESEWARAARKLRQQKSDGLVHGYYDQSYIDHLKNGDTVVSQAYSGDIFQVNLDRRYQNLKLLIPADGGMFWTDNMCIPVNAPNPKDAMFLMDFYYDPDAQAVVEYADDYVCPVPTARQVLMRPSGWAKPTLQQMRPSIGMPPTVAANAPTVFPTEQYIKNTRYYYRYQSQDELDVWNSLFSPIVAAA